MTERHVQSNNYTTRPSPACGSNYCPQSKTSPHKFKANTNHRYQQQQMPHHQKPLAYSCNELPAKQQSDSFCNNRNLTDISQNSYYRSFGNTHECIEECEDEALAVSLEVEIAESLRDLVQTSSHDTKNCKSNQNPQRHNNPVDVIVNQQSESMRQTTLSLGMEEVSQLLDIASDKTNHAQNIESPEDREEENQRQVTEERRRKQEEKMNFYTSVDFTSDEEFSDDLYAQSIVPPHLQQVYTTPHHTFDQIKSKLPCLTKSRLGPEEESDKPGTPCLCQHCGMVGVLIESQKRPAIPHSPNPKFNGYPRNYSGGGGSSATHHLSRNTRKIVDLRTKSKSETNIILLKELTMKIASLEDRLNEQEEKTVRKDYFKFVIHKLLTQYTNKINELRTATVYANRPSINIATQYSRKGVNMSRTSHQRHGHTPERDHNKYYPVNVSTHQNHQSHKSSSEDCSVLSSDRYYKRVYKAKASKRSNNSSRNDFAQGRSKVKTVYMANEVQPSSNAFQEKDVESNLSAHAIKNLCDFVYNKYYDGKQATMEDKLVEDHASKVVPEKLGKSVHPEPTTKNRNNLPQSTSQCAKRMDIAYVSPALKTWHDESEQEFAPTNNSNVEKRRPQHQPQDACNITSGTTNLANNAKNKAKHSIEEKINYLKFLAKRKHVDESELWSNILNQAKKHIRSSEDTVSIQLPRIAHGPDMSELELTLSKLKDIVKSSQVARKKSKPSVENQASKEAPDKIPVGKKRQHSFSRKTTDTDSENMQKANVTSR